VLTQPDLSAGAPWKQRIRAPIIAWSSRAAQNPSRGLLCSSKDGVYQLYAWNTQTEELRQLTQDPAGVSGGVISADGERVYYLRDQRGDEIGHYVAVPFSGGEPEDISPDLPEYASHFLAESASGSALGFFAADPDGFHFYIFGEPGAAEPAFALTKKALSFGPLLSQDAEIAIIASSEKTGNAEYALEAWDVRRGELIAELWDGAGSGIAPGEFSAAPGDMRFAGSSNAGGYHRPFIWNPLTGERQDIQSEQFRGDVKFRHWSPDGARLLLHQVHRAMHSLYIYDIAAADIRPLNSPAGVPSGGSGFLPDGKIQIHFEDSTAPPRLLELDDETGAVSRSVIDLGVSLPASAPWRSVSYQSPDGTAIQAWLATPAGGGPFPTIVHTHGGPTAVMANRWAPEAQTWLDHGFAFFSLNYRGSTTFGYEFQHAIDGNLGDLEVEDIAAGVAWLIDSGIAQADAILKTGGSYGGYLTLQSLGKKPALWAGGMAVVAIADWTLMYEDQAETLRGYQRAMFGGTPQEKPAAHQKSSPITYAETISAPILVLQGENDTRCPARQMRVYEQRLKELGKFIEVRWFDAGHGSLDNEERIDMQAKMLRFAYRILENTVGTADGQCLRDPVSRPPERIGMNPSPAQPFAPILGVQTVPLQPFGDDRGRFMETFRKEWFPSVNWDRLQSNRSDSSAGVLRGLHYHFKQVDYWLAVRGRIRVGLVDLRRSSPTYLKSASLDMGEDNPLGLFIPEGVAHGFAALTDCTLMYIVNNYYDGGADEFGIAWNDPGANIDWGIASPALSPRDQANPLIADIPPADQPL